MSTSPTAQGTIAADLLAAWREIGDGTAAALELDNEVESILVEIARLGFELATISLVDDYRRVIEAFRGWNIPSGWIKRAKHRLDPQDDKDDIDIQADVVRNKKTERVTGWDKRLDPEIYARFEHSKLSRIWVPIVNGGTVVGTIEAGCAVERKSVILTENNIQAVEQLGKDRGPAIARTRPYVLLKLIAEKAVEVVGADSASLHVYQSGGLLLMAGAGIASQDLLGTFSPDKTGADRVMRGREPLVLTPSQDQAVSIGLYRLGVRSVAAFPLSLGGDCYGVVSLYFCTEQKLGAAALELGSLFVRQMDVAIQNSLLLKDLAAVAGLAWNLSSFQSVIQSLASNRSLRQVLEEVASSILYMLDADSLTLYQFFQNENSFECPPVMKGFFREPDSMHTPTRPDDIVWKLVQQGQSRFVEDVSWDPVFSGTDDPTRRTRFIDREGIKSCAALVLKPGQGNEIVGCVFINYRDATHFSSEDKRVISALASSAAIAIQTARLHAQIDRDLERRSKQLEGLRAVDYAIVSTTPVPDLQRVLNVVLEHAVKITGADSGQVMWVNRWDKVLECKARWGFPEDAKACRPKIGEGTIGQVAQRGESMMFSRATDWHREVEMGLVPPGTQTQIAVPLVDSSGLLGVLSVEHSRSGAFRPDDTSLLEGFAVQAIIAVHTVNLYWQVQRQIKPLQALTQIAARSHDVRSDLATNLRMLLTGVTAGEGLGLSRAMLFLTDGSELRGAMAIGAQTRQEAEATWQRLDQEPPKSLAVLLDDVAERSAYIRDGGDDCPLSIAVQRVSIPLNESAGAPAICAIKGKPVPVADDQGDSFRKVLERVSHKDRGHAFMCVPLIGKGEEKSQSIGVLVCDNRFLLNEREIDPECVRGIEAFAAVAAMSIENDRLRQDLTDQQRLENWRYAVKKAEHRLKGRVANIAAAAYEIQKCVRQPTGTILVHEIEDRLKRLEKIIEGIKWTLEEFERFAEPRQPRLDKLNLVELLAELIPPKQGDCEIHFQRPKDTVFVRGDGDLLGDVFTELIKNARDAMAGDNEGRSKRITITVSLEEGEHESMSAVVELADTGPGIAPDKAGQKNWIFTPFETTKRDLGGTGLGLAIADQDVRAHNGMIAEVGAKGEGARFVLRLPAVGSNADL